MKPSSPRSADIFWAAAVVLGCGLSAAHGRDVAIPDGHVLPAQYLAALQPPEFAPGHTLPRLTRYGWTLDFDTRVEFARRWGYALEWGSVTWLNGCATAEAVQQAIDDPTSDAGKCVRLAAEQPETFKLSVICCRDLPPKRPGPPTASPATSRSRSPSWAEWSSRPVRRAPSARPRSWPAGRRSPREP